MPENLPNIRQTNRPNKQLLPRAMKSKGKWGLLVGFILLLTACSPVSKIETDVLEPAEMAFPGDVYSVGYLIGEPHLEVNTRTNEIDVDARQQFWTGLMDVANTSPRFNPRSLRLVEPSKDSIPSDTLSWQMVKHWTDSLDLDALAVMHRFSLYDSLKRKLVFDLGASNYYFIYQVHAQVQWRIYDPAQRRIFHEHEYEEQFVWESASPQEREAIRGIVDLDRAFRLSSYWSGYDIGRIMFPYWVTESRSYFSGGSRNFRNARDYVEQNQWQNAIDLWKKSFKSNNEQLAFRAAYNIAFALEMLGKIDQAIEWLKRAQQIQFHNKTQEYLEILHQRQQKLDKLDEQMPI